MNKDKYRKVQEKILNHFLTSDNSPIYIMGVNTKDSETASILLGNLLVDKGVNCLPVDSDFSGHGGLFTQDVIIVGGDYDNLSSENKEALAGIICSVNITYNNFNFYKDEILGVDDYSQIVDCESESLVEFIVKVYIANNVSMTSGVASLALNFLNKQEKSNGVALCEQYLRSQIF